MVLAAIFRGADNGLVVIVRGWVKLDCLRQFLPIENGIACHDTFNRVFAILNREVFERCFLALDTLALWCFKKGMQVAWDGKTIRSSPSASQKAFHRVSPIPHQLGVDLRLSQDRRDIQRNHGNTRVPGGDCFKACRLTNDAMGCQKAIAAQVMRQKQD